MRKLGIEVDCAADIAEARSWWRADLYNLVLINMENEIGARATNFAKIFAAPLLRSNLHFWSANPSTWRLRRVPSADPSGQTDQSSVRRREKAALRPRIFGRSAATLGNPGSVAANFRGAIRIAVARTKAMREPARSTARLSKSRHAKRAAADPGTFDELTEKGNAMKNIYVGNLPHSTTEAELRNVFEAHGAVEKVSIVTDRETGRSRGFAFVEMTDAGEADKAIAALNGTELGGRALTINEAKPKTDRPKAERWTTIWRRWRGAWTRRLPGPPRQPREPRW